MKFLKPLILESKQRGYLYHFTSKYAAFKILEKMEFIASSYYDDDRDYFMKDKYKYRISFTRNKYLWKDLTLSQKKEGQLTFEACLKFDGDVLSRRYKIIPHDDNWKFDDSKILTKRNYDMGDEREERLYTNNEIVHVNKSLKEITLLFDTKYDYTIWIKDNERLQNFKKLCKFYNVKLNIYFKGKNETIEII